MADIPQMPAPISHSVVQQLPRQFMLWLERLRQETEGHQSLVYQQMMNTQHADTAKDVAALEALLYVLPMIAKSMNVNKEIADLTTLNFMQQGFPVQSTPRTVTYDSTVTLDANDYGKVIILDDGVSNIGATLPDIQEGDVTKWMCFVRGGTGDMTIRVPGTETIGPSSAGGHVKSDEVRTHPFLSVMVTGSTHWTPGLPFGGYGIFKVY